MKNFAFKAAALLISGSMLVPSYIHAETLTERRAAKNKAQSVEIEVACGKADKENCAIVIPEANSRTVPNGIRLKPLESQGSVESTNALCDGGTDGGVNAAVVQADVLFSFLKSTVCNGKVTYLGSPLYPYVGYMIVGGKNSYDDFEKLVANVPDGKVLHVAAGGSGSGGEFTLRTVLASNPSWKSRIVIEADAGETALNKLKDGAVDAFFVMDGPNSPLLQRVKGDVDLKTNKPYYKFVDFRPNSDLRAMKYNGNNPLYATVTVAPGIFSSTKTLATTAVFAVTNELYRDNGVVAGKMRQGIEDSLPAIAAQSGARAEWRQDFAPR